MNSRMAHRHYLFGITIASIFLQLCIQVPEVKTAELVQYYCGKTLMQTLSLVCQSRYNRPNDKRYLEDAYDNTLMLEADYMKSPSTFLNDLLLGGPSDVYDPDLPRLRITKGVVDDCCYNPCSFSTLRLYCS